MCLAEFRVRFLFSFFNLVDIFTSAVSSGESVDVSCTYSEKVSIVTIPERIVTVSARTSLSTDISYNDEEGERIPPKLTSKVQAPHKVRK